MAMAAYDLESVITFLSDLSFNNNREWFEQHKAVYEKNRVIFEEFVAELIGSISAYGDVSGANPKNSIMRIYRDVRFSKDKTPYNVWMSAHIAKGGKKSGSLGFGLRLAPGESGSAGGLWSPTPPQLAKFRTTITRDPDTFMDIVDYPDFVRRFGGLQGEKLKTVPKGFDKDHPLAETLKRTQIFAHRIYDDDNVFAADFMDQLTEDYRALLPFLDYMNDIIGQ
jgi:uncharacterized protein (TIGR02453 family)